jgi:hypothetical protein
MDIPITINCFHILMGIIIGNPTRTIMVQRTSTMTTHVMKMVAKEKTRSYTKQTLGDDFIPLAIETYGCFDSFLIACAHTIIMCHQRSSLVPSKLISYY